MSYKKPEVLMIPSKRETFSADGKIKMIFGIKPISFAGCDTKNIAR